MIGEDAMQSLVSESSLISTKKQSITLSLVIFYVGFQIV